MRSIVVAVSVALIAGCATTTQPPLPSRANTPAPAVVTPPDDRLASELVVRALSLIGVPYRYGGTSLQTGFDCSGLVRYVFAQVAGYSLPYDARGMSTLGQRVGRNDLQPGDLVFFNTLRRPYSHVGIYVGERRFIHAPSSGGSVEVSDMSRRYWRDHYDGARRLPL